jgi:AcrR family transcriptional regulator
MAGVGLGTRRWAAEAAGWSWSVQSRRSDSERVMAQTGRVLGPRALKTRQRLLEATAQLLRERSVLDISVVEIARKAETSPATFYHYFKDVEEATLQLARQAVEEMPPLIERIDGRWDAEHGFETARGIAEAFLNHWEAHHAVLLIRNLAADNGDARFQEVRRDALSPVLDRLAEHITAAQADSNVSPTLHPFAAAAALGSILERLSAHADELAHRGVTRDALIDTCAGILFQVVTGSRLE